MELTGQALRLSRQGAQAIVEEVGAIVGQHINMMDPEGYVIASTDPERIGTLHEGARKIILPLTPASPPPGADPACVPGWKHCRRNRYYGTV